MVGVLVLWCLCLHVRGGGGGRGSAIKFLHSIFVCHSVCAEIT